MSEILVNSLKTAGGVGSLTFDSTGDVLLTTGRLGRVAGNTITIDSDGILNAASVNVSSAITLPSGAIDSAAIGTGAVSANKIASGAVEGAMTTQFGRRNLIINGAMQVAQRGTRATTDGYATVDRFKSNYGGGTVTQSQESLSSGAPFELGFHKFFRTTNTSVVTDTAAHFRLIRQSIEDQNVATSGWNYKSSDSSITLSFWVRSSVAQEFYAYLLVAPTSYNYAFSLGTLSANTWTKVTKTIPGNSNLSFDNDNTIGIELNILPFFGTNYTASGSTTDAWFAFNSASRVPDMTSTWATTSGATFDITGVQLEVGTVATPFEHRSYGEELALCQRYYQEIQGPGGTRIALGFVFSSTQVRCIHDLRVTMRTAPSIKYASASGFTLEFAGGHRPSVSNVTFDIPSPDTAAINVTSSHSRSDNNCCQLYTAATSDFMGFDAEL